MDVDKRCIANGVDELREWEDPTGGDYAAGDLFGRITEAFHLIWPEQTKGDNQLGEDYITWTCEEGPVALNDAKPQAMMIPACEDAPYYCGFAQIAKSLIQDRLIKQGYENLEAKVPKRVSREMGLSNILQAMVMNRREGDGRDWLKLATRWAERFRHGPDAVCKGETWETPLVLDIIRLYAECKDLTIDALANNDDARGMVGQLFGLLPVYPDDRRVGLYVVPRWLYAANRALVERGWPPVTPQWLNPHKCQYNRGYGGACQGDFRGFSCYPKPTTIENRVLSLYVTSYNLHVPYNPINHTNIRPPVEWEKKARSLMHELSEGEPGTAFLEEQRRAFGLAMLRELPVVVQRQDKELDYFRVQVTKEGDTGGYIPNEVDVLHTDAEGKVLHKLTGQGRRPSVKSAVVKALPMNTKLLDRYLKDWTNGKLDAQKFKHLYGNNVQAAVRYVQERMLDDEQGRKADGTERGEEAGTPVAAAKGIFGPGPGLPEIPVVGGG